MTAWSLVYDRFDPGQEGLREALCTLGNGYFATRGAAAETKADDTHYPGTYLAGGYNRLRTEIAGRVIENEDLVNFPNWLPLTFRIGEGAWFDLSAVEILDYRQELDLKQGVLMRAVHFRDRAGRETMLASRRLVHMADPHLAAEEMRITPGNWSGSLCIRSALDGRVNNAGVRRYRALNDVHLRPLETGAVAADAILLKVETNQSGIRMAHAARTRIGRNGEATDASRRTVTEPGYIAQELSLELAPHDTVTAEKTVALFTSRDHAISESGIEARKTVARAGDFEALLRSHARAWSHLWRRFDIGLEAGDERILRILRLHIFHLLQTVSPNTVDLDVGVPARGLHGEAYRGHIFWDELFIFPLLNLRIPEITRALLRYRYRRLGEARAAAREAGYAGAMYPWQSGSDGREESQVLHLNPKSGRWIPDHSRLQRHVNIAIAYNVWQYFQVTGDIEFLNVYGAEMLLEIARFWASIARFNHQLDRYEILGVMGPDEYHDAYPDALEPGLDNNAYTNVMATWVLCRAVESLDLLTPDRRAELQEILDLRPDEVERWNDISRRMRVPFHGDGIISQFEGYERLQEFDWRRYREKYGDIQRLDRILEGEGDSPNRYQVSKQADVLMLFYLLSADELNGLFTQLGYSFGPEIIPRNIDYYLHRTSHGSTLSRVVHSWVLARSDRSHSWQLFSQALESDIADVQGGTTPEGIHLGAMAGTVDLVQRGYTGIVMRGDTLWLDPSLPDEMQKLDLRIHYRGHALRLVISSDRLSVQHLQGTAPALRIGVIDAVHELRAGERREFPLR